MRFFKKRYPPYMHTPLSVTPRKHWYFNGFRAITILNIPYI